MIHAVNLIKILQMEMKNLIIEKISIHVRCERDKEEKENRKYDHESQSWKIFSSEFLHFNVIFRARIASKKMTNEIKANGHCLRKSVCVCVCAMWLKR